mmetsp:Transcript_137654/g.274578  ORF Transcript_137654/g.274578 Transcript_137654/m.274578 type:complete len:308 (-) Transcript_137654:8-931(-)
MQHQGIRCLSPGVYQQFDHSTCQRRSTKRRNRNCGRLATSRNFAIIHAKLASVSALHQWLHVCRNAWVGDIGDRVVRIQYRRLWHRHNLPVQCHFPRLTVCLQCHTIRAANAANGFVVSVCSYFWKLWVCPGSRHHPALLVCFPLLPRGSLLRGAPRFLFRLTTKSLQLPASRHHGSTAMISPFQQGIHAAQHLELHFWMCSSIPGTADFPQAFRQLISTFTTKPPDSITNLHTLVTCSHPELGQRRCSGTNWLALCTIHRCERLPCRTTGKAPALFYWDVRCPNLLQHTCELHREGRRNHWHSKMA